MLTRITRIRPLAYRFPGHTIHHHRISISAPGLLFPGLKVGRGQSAHFTSRFTQRASDSSPLTAPLQHLLILACRAGN